MISIQSHIRKILSGVFTLIVIVGINIFSWMQRNMKDHFFMYHDSKAMYCT
jgi:hypothetical protein